MWSSCLRREGELRDKNGGTSSGRQPLRCGKISRPPFWFEGSCPGRSRSTFASTFLYRLVLESTFKRSDFASYFRPLRKLQLVYCIPKVIFPGNGKIIDLPPLPSPRRPRRVSPLPQGQTLEPLGTLGTEYLGSFGWKTWGETVGHLARKMSNFHFGWRGVGLNLRDLLRQCRKRIEGRGLGTKK